MSNENIFTVTSQKYPGLIGKQFDINKGTYLLLKDGKAVAQSNSTVLLVEKVPIDAKPSDGHYEIANLYLVRDDLYFFSYLHCITNGYNLMTPPLNLIYIDMNGVEKQISREFMVDTGSTTTGIPEDLQPFQQSTITVPYETCGGIVHEPLTKIDIIIDGQKYCIMAVIHKGTKCILGLDILKYYVMHLDGGRAGLLIKNNLPPKVEEDVIVFE